MAEYIDKETILDDLDRDIKVTNKERLLAKERHCVEDRMRYAKKLDHLRGFREYIKSLPTADVISLDLIKEAREEIENLNLNDYGDNLYQLQAKCSEILSKLIESEKDE